MAEGWVSTYIRIYLIYLGSGTINTHISLLTQSRNKKKGPNVTTGTSMAASRWRSSWEAGCQQLTAEMGVNDYKVCSALDPNKVNELE